jgi:hypothetical protein
MARICHAKAALIESNLLCCEESLGGGRISPQVGLYIFASFGQRSLLNQLVLCSSFVKRRLPGDIPMYGAKVAAVTLTCVPWWPV